MSVGLAKMRLRELSSSWAEYWLFSLRSFVGRLWGGLEMLVTAVWVFGWVSSAI